MFRTNNADVFLHYFRSYILRLGLAFKPASMPGHLIQGFPVQFLPTGITGGPLCPLSFDTNSGHLNSGPNAQKGRAINTYHLTSQLLFYIQA